MKAITYYQGDDIPITIELFDDDTQQIPINIDLLQDLIVYIYTDGARIVRATKVAKTGFITLSKVSSYEYNFIVPSAETKMLTPGQMRIEISINDGTAIKNTGASNIAILSKTLIKKEL